MSEPVPSDRPTTKQTLFYAAAAIPFLLSLALAGYALNTGVLMAFGIAWPLLQGFGYYSTLKMSKGDVTHPLVTSQIILHYIVLILLIAILSKAL